MMSGRPPALRRRVVCIPLALAVSAALASCAGQRAALSAPPSTPIIAPADPAAVGGDLDLPTATGGVPPIPTTLVPPSLDLPEYTAELDIVTCRLDVSVPNDSLGFTVASAEIPAGPGHELLVAIAGSLADASEVTVVGHSSSEGDPAFNLDLSRRRAQAAAAILAPLLPGVALRVDGVGSADPLVP